METLPSNHIRSLIPSKKLLLSRKLDVNKRSLPLLRKRAPKYARHASVDYENFYKRDLNQLKSIFSFNFPKKHWRAEKLKFAPSHIFQILKSHQKFIRRCEGIRMTPRLAKELPLLSEHEVDYLQPKQSEEYRVLGYLPSLHKIFFNLQIFGGDSNQIESILQKNRTRVLRAIVRMRSLEKLRMKFGSRCSMSLFAFLQVFGSCPLFLSHLKYFSIEVSSFRDPATIEEDLIGDSRVQRALRFVTHLDLPDYQWFGAIINKETLNNVISLKVKINAKEVLEATIKKLCYLGLATKLKHLNLSLWSFSNKMENLFLESFSLPREVESVQLALKSFAWEDRDLFLTEDTREMIENSFKTQPRFQSFYNQWKDLKRLHALELIIQDYLPTRGCQKLALSFAKGILRQVKDLRKLNYQHEKNLSSRFDGDLKQIFPMDLREFWDCLESSKNTLEDLHIQDFKKMNLFEKESLEGLSELKNLKLLKIYGEVYGGMNLGDFLRKLSKGSESVVEVHILDLCFEETGQLKGLFANMVEIPRNVDVELTVDVSNLNWEEILCEYMIKVRGEGKLKLNLHLEKLTHRKILELLQEKFKRNSPLIGVAIQQTKAFGSWSFCK